LSAGILVPAIIPGDEPGFLFPALIAPASADAGAFCCPKKEPMYPQSSGSAVSAVSPVVVVAAASAIVAIAVAVVVWDIARRAIARVDADKVPAVLLAIAAMLGPLASCLPWSGQTSALKSLLRDRSAQTTISAHDPELPGGEP
jgi:hypothetical protein